MGILWMLREANSTAEQDQDLGRPTLLLFRQRSGVVQKLKKWMEQWSQANYKEIPELLEEITDMQEAERPDAP